MKKNIVISGITKGIGLAIATQFLNSTEWNIYGFARKPDDFVTDKTSIAVERKQFDFHHVYFDDTSEPCFCGIDKIDVQKTEEIKKFCKKIDSTDILINNVGIYSTGSLFTEPDTQWHELFNINLNAAYYLTKYLYPTFHKGTHIFNICSVASKEIVKEAPSYSVSKMALYGLHKAMVQELEPMGIKVTAVLPGAVYTNSWKDVPETIQNVILPASDIAEVIWDIYHLSPQTMVREIEIKPLNF